MTDTFRALCKELVDSVELLLEMRAVDAKPMAITEDRVSRARALLAQPVAEKPTDEEIISQADKFLAYSDAHMGDPARWEGSDVDLVAFIRHALARWGRPAAQPEEGDIHYAWELHDAEGDWQAGGSANSLEDVQREGNHYLKTYSQDGPHKLIIQRHCVSTIEEVTND